MMWMGVALVLYFLSDWLNEIMPYGMTKCSKWYKKGEKYADKIWGVIFFQLLQMLICIFNLPPSRSGRPIGRYVTVTNLKSQKIACYIYSAAGANIFKKVPQARNYI